MKTLKDFQDKGDCGDCEEGVLCCCMEIKHGIIELIKKIRSMDYGQRLCLNCDKIYGGGNSGQQYCCKGDDGELRFLEQQTGSSTGAVEILMKTNNITEEDLK